MTLFISYDVILLGIYVWFLFEATTYMISGYNTLILHVNHIHSPEIVVIHAISQKRM